MCGLRAQIKIIVIVRGFFFIFPLIIISELLFFLRSRLKMQWYIVQFISPMQFSREIALSAPRKLFEVSKSEESRSGSFAVSTNEYGTDDSCRMRDGTSEGQIRILCLRVTQTAFLADYLTREEVIAYKIANPLAMFRALGISVFRRYVQWTYISFCILTLSYFDMKTCKVILF